jgi:hypothetical protein
MAWKKGLPMPPDTWYWGGVVTVGMEEDSGFRFASFCGDHVLLDGEKDQRVEAREIVYYNNDLIWPVPKEVKES